LSTITINETYTRIHAISWVLGRCTTAPPIKVRTSYVHLQLKNCERIELRAKHEDGRIELQKKKERKERNYGFIVDITVVQVQNAIYFFVNDKTKNNIE
jgi:hypothetical protein